MVKGLYTTLMEKYHWTESQIDSEDFFSVLDLETGDWKKEVTQAQQEPIVFIDDLGF